MCEHLFCKYLIIRLNLNQTRKHGKNSMKIQYAIIVTTLFSFMHGMQQDQQEKIKLKPYEEPSLFRPHLQPIYHPTENAIGLLSISFSNPMPFSGVVLNELNKKFSSIKNISFAQYNNFILLTAFTKDIYKDKVLLIAKLKTSKSEVHYLNICRTEKLLDVKLFAKNKQELWYKYLVLDKKTKQAKEFENNSNILLTSDISQSSS